MGKYTIYGREFCRRTMDALAYFDDESLPYDFCDIDFDEEAMYFIKHHKIIGLPVLLRDGRFLVGWNQLVRERLRDL